tara:strand:- start:72 stop:515 length:444 start_codon:yes stop_codon:yes gene_type:complete
MISELKINFDFGKLAEKVPSIIDKYLNDSVAEDVIKASKAKIKSGNVRPMLSTESTIPIRQRRGTGTTPLFESGRLHDSLIKSKEGIKVIDYGLLHLKGYTTKKGSLIPKKKVPARNFIDIPKTFSDDIYDNFNKALKLSSPIVLKL